MEDDMASAMLLTGPATDREEGRLGIADAYETRRQLHLQEMRSRVPAHLERLSWPAERLRIEREARLRQLVRIAQQRSAWHRERLGQVKADELAEDDLVSLP